MFIQKSIKQVSIDPQANTGAKPLNLDQND
jgi:hypothetical protein